MNDELTLLDLDRIEESDVWYDEWAIVGSHLVFAVTRYKSRIPTFLKRVQERHPYLEFTVEHCHSQFPNSKHVQGFGWGPIDRHCLYDQDW